MKNCKVGFNLLNEGFKVTVNNRKFSTKYPRKNWNSLSYESKYILVSSIAYFFTRHLPLLQSAELEYNFPPPLLKSLYDHGFFYSIFNSSPDYSSNNKIYLNLLQKLYNSEFNVSFKHFPEIITNEKPVVSESNSAAVLFTFGKDSLLTFSILKEIGITPNLFYFKEPLSLNEVDIKQNLIKQFVNSFKVNIKAIDVPLGKLRQNGKQYWGWDLLVTQYTLLLIPYIKYLKSQYYFFSNENSTNVFYKVAGFKFNPFFEQSPQWMLHLNNIFRLFSLKTLTGSILEPINEILIMYILHHRYPQYAKYQLSCDNDETENKNIRWCQNCSECVRIYIFLLAIDINPESVGFTQNMLKSKKLSNFIIFSDRLLSKDFNEASSEELERIFAFYLAYLRGHRKDIFKLFEKVWLKKVKLNEKFFLRKYLTVYPSITVPDNIKKKILPIYNKERNKILKEIRFLISGTS